MAFKLFQNTGLFETFKISKDKFIRFMKVLENGYREIPCEYCDTSIVAVCNILVGDDRYGFVGLFQSCLFM